MSQTFHADSEVPAGTNFDDGVALSLGFRFSVAVAGTVTHARWRAADAVSGTVKWALFRQSDSFQMTTEVITSYTVSAWNTVPLTTPVHIAAGVPYMAVYWTPNKYVATSAYFVSPQVVGDITSEAGAGRFDSAADISYANSSFNNGCYFVDLVFQPDGAVSGASPSGQAVPVNLGQPTAALGLSSFPGGLTVPVALGQPAAALGLAATPGGLAIPVALGQPTVGPAGVSPSGLAIPVAIGQPAVSLARSAAPLGLAIPVATGQPSTIPPVATDSPNRPILATAGGRVIVASSGGRAATQ